MPNIREKDIRVGADAVYEILTTGGGDVDTAVEESLQIARRFARPRGFYQAFPIAMDGNLISLPREHVLESGWLSQELAGCSQLAVVVLTVGQAYSREVDTARQSDPLTGRVMDVVAHLALKQWGEAAWEEIRDHFRADGLRLTPYLHPGTADFTLFQLRTLFSLLDTESLDVELGRGCRLIPRLSMAAVLGLGRDIAGASGGHECRACGYFDCILNPAKIGGRAIEGLDNID